MSPEYNHHIDIEGLKGRVNLLELAAHFTPLTRYSRRTGEYAGPCPHCGGEDRFHVVEATQRFYCRHCTPRGGDVIDFVQLVHAVDFREACRMLGAEELTVPARKPDAGHLLADWERSETSWQNPEYQQSARRTIYATHNLLLSGEGRAGQEYLYARGLSEETWRAYSLGYGQTYHPIHHRQMDAIFIPWYDAYFVALEFNHNEKSLASAFEPGSGRITAIQHRFIDPDLRKNERYIFKPGSSPVLFGAQALRPAETLVVVEGEFNCMALHQGGVQALSLGAEANSRNQEGIAVLAQFVPLFDNILVWYDKPAYAQALAEKMATDVLFRKKVHSISSTMDANDLLVASKLEEFVAAQTQ